MNHLDSIPLANLMFLMVPAALVILLMLRWQADWRKGILSLARMLLQLVAIGYALSWIFAVDQPGVMFALLMVMMLIASWIALNVVTEQRMQWLGYSVVSVVSVSLLTLAMIIVAVLQVEPWYQPNTIIPIGGMVFSSCMTSISLAAERFQSELNGNADVVQARNKAFATAMIPTINSLLAVGLVSLPGMMTGQILSGVSPLIAARYQIMVMLMLFVSSGLSAGLFLALVTRQKQLKISG